MRERLEKLLADALAEIEAVAGMAPLKDLKTKYLGRKGLVPALFKDLSRLAAAEKKDAGELINRVKNSIEEEIGRRLGALEQSEKAERLSSERIDVTLPGRRTRLGHTHPVSQVLYEIEDIFTSMGFTVAEGPEVETDYYNFTALNFPKDHPARDMQDTFFVDGGTLLRTHTSPVQIREMERRDPPLRIIAPGTVYRRDSDITHTPMFHQVEGFMVDTDINFSNLKGTLTHFLKRLFGEDTATRFRPSFFPFTEPSAEVDIRCVMCKGSGCRVCKNTGWLEILGAGMIHPEVFRSVNYDTEKYSGFAFGLGIERIAMLKFGIDDIRLFFENDLRFLEQF